MTVKRIYTIEIEVTNLEVAHTDEEVLAIVDQLVASFVTKGGDAVRRGPVIVVEHATKTVEMEVFVGQSKIGDVVPVDPVDPAPAAARGTFFSDG